MAHGPDPDDPAQANDRYAPTRADLRLLVDTLPEPVLMAGQIGAAKGDSLRGGARGPVLLLANPAARELFHIRREGLPLTAAVRHPPTLEAIAAAFAGEDGEAVLESGGVQSRIWRVRTRPLQTADRGMRTVIVTLHDESDLRRAERLRADFLANASHELRTPLASISGFIDTLAGPARDDPPARDRFLQIMASQAARMGRLIEDLLSLSRIELNEHIAPAGQVDLARAVREVTEAIVPQGQARARLVVSLPPAGRALIPGDHDQIVQVAQNLVDNALKYAGQDGEVTVRVEMDVGLAPSNMTPASGPASLYLLEPERTRLNRYAILRVSDDGPGISRASLPRLSERFYRVEGQKSSEHPGTGLGLAIVKHIVNRHHGGLSVESAPGQGAVFTAAFPMVAERDLPGGPA